MSTQNNESTFQEMSRSMDALCNRVSMFGIDPPKYEDINDVFDFIGTYERITSGLTDEAKVHLIQKSFPPGRYKAWFETELLPLVERSVPWSNIKAKIIDRFSNVEDRDRHFRRLHQLKYDPSIHRKVLDYVEDVIYSYKKAHTSESDEEACVRFVKTSLPNEIVSALNLIQEFRSAKDINGLKSAVKQYDNSISVIHNKTGDKAELNEMISIFKDLLKQTKKEREAVVAALQAMPEKYERKQETSRRRESSRDRSVSPFNRDRNQSSSYGQSRSPRDRYQA